MTIATKYVEITHSDGKISVYELTFGDKVRKTEFLKCLLNLNISSLHISEIEEMIYQFEKAERQSVISIKKICEIDCKFKIKKSSEFYGQYNFLDGLVN